MHFQLLGGVQTSRATGPTCQQNLIRYPRLPEPSALQIFGISTPMFHHSWPCWLLASGGHQVGEGWHTPCFCTGRRHDLYDQPFCYLRVPDKMDQLLEAWLQKVVSHHIWRTKGRDKLLQTVLRMLKSDRCKQGDTSRWLFSTFPPHGEI